MQPPSDPRQPASAPGPRERQREARARRAVAWGRSILLGSATLALLLAARHLIDIPQGQRPAPAAVLVVGYLLTCWVTLSGRLDGFFSGRRR